MRFSKHTCPKSSLMACRSESTLPVRNDVPSSSSSSTLGQKVGRNSLDGKKSRYPFLHDTNTGTVTVRYLVSYCWEEVHLRFGSATYM